MKTVKNFVSNIPLYIGVGFYFVAAGSKAVGDAFAGLSFKVHALLKTDVGLSIIAMKSQLKAMRDQFLAMEKDNSKVAEALKTTETQTNEALPEGVISLGDKRKTKGSN